MGVIARHKSAEAISEKGTAIVRDCHAPLAMTEDDFHSRIIVPLRIWHQVWW